MPKLTNYKAINHKLSSISALFLSLNPALLYRENATGRTPLEMARDMYFASTVADPPACPQNSSIGPNHYRSVLAHNPTLYVGKNIKDSPALKWAEVEPEPEESAQRTYVICMQADEELEAAGIEGECQRKRRLASLFEANQVAHRLAARNRLAAVKKELDDEQKDYGLWDSVDNLENIWTG